MQEAQIICGRERYALRERARGGAIRTDLGDALEKLERPNLTLVTPKINLEDRHELPATEIKARQVPGLCYMVGGY